MSIRRASLVVTSTFVLTLAGTASVVTQPRSPAVGEWRAYASTTASTKYSPLDQIHAGNAQDLRVVWRQSAIPESLRGGRAVSELPLPTNYQHTPLMVGGLLYMSTGFGSVAALDPTTGAVVWHERMPARDEGPSRSVHNRGLAYWTDGTDARIVAIRGQYLVALNAKTGARYPDFGTDGDVNLSQNFSRPGEAFSWRSAPLVVKDVIVVGGLGGPPGDNTTEFSTAQREGAPGHVRGYDVRSGKLLWTFRTIPRPGEFGNDTWLNDSWSYTGDAGVWTLMTADEELGYVYLPVSTPTGDYYGGSRPGNNLFAESLVCLDARTGKRVWHFQAVHHGIWDYDFGSAPVLADITVGGRRIKAVAQVSKQSFLYVFDRVTGQPVWPIEERPVPKGDVPGEWYSPTQPVPLDGRGRPFAYDQQGVTLDDLIDFTPELRAAAVRIVNQYRYGPLFTPPSVAGGADGKKGTIQQPGTVATIWTGAGLDPDTNILYVPSVHGPVVLELAKPRGPKANLAYVRKGLTWAEGPEGLPLFKPPYGRLVAIDLNKGEVLWTVANGNGPRDHPAIKHLNLPPLGQPGRAAPLVTKSLVFIGEGTNDGVPHLPPFGGGKMFRALDKMTGRVVAELELPGGTSGAPMTYMAHGKQFIVVAVGWKGMAGELVALALP
ncbi:MAG: PQQ-binding-like beta-propeller repeat protein [Vicinamibacterales bacterium]